MKSKTRKYVIINCKSCQKEMNVCKGNLKQLSGFCKSCSAKRRPSNRTTHGMSNSRIYGIWEDMKERCNNKKSVSFKNYGRKGIKVCEEWNKSFIQFYEWAINNGYEENLTIDRIDNNKNYCPENCKWSTRMTQNNNTSRNHYLTYNGRTHTIAEWSRILNIKYATLNSRLNKNWNPERIFTSKLERRKS